jgi:hypothetical protein
MCLASATILAGLQPDEVSPVADP